MFSEFNLITYHAISELIEPLSEMEDLLDEYSESERYKNDSLVPLFCEI